MAHHRWLLVGIAACGGGGDDPVMVVDSIGGRADAITTCGAATIPAGAACLNLNWQYGLVGFDGTPSPDTCPGGAIDTVVAIAESTDVNGNPIAACDAAGIPAATARCAVATFDCFQGFGQQIVPGGFHRISLRTASHDGATVVATTPPQFQLLDDRQTAFVLGTFLANGGYYRARWQLEKAGAPTTCLAVGANLLVEVSTRLGTVTFPCEAGDGAFNYSMPMPADTFDLTVRLFDATHAQLGAVATTSVTIGTEDAVADTGPLVIAIP